MRNKKSKLYVRCAIFRPHPFCKLPHFLRLLPPLEREVLYACRKTFITRHAFSAPEALQPNYSAHAGCYSPIQELCLCWPPSLDTPCVWITILVTYSAAAEMT